MRKLFVLFLGVFLVFAIFLQIGFSSMCGCLPTCKTCKDTCTCDERVSCRDVECDDSKDCLCDFASDCHKDDDSPCSSCGIHHCVCGNIVEQDKQLVSIYEGDTEPTYYPSEGEPKYKYKSPEDYYDHPFCGSSPNPTCRVPGLYSYKDYCGNWGKCDGNRGCICNDSYCIGWCAHQAEKTGVSFDGPNFAKCGYGVVGDCSVHGEKYEEAYKIYKGHYIKQQIGKRWDLKRNSYPFCTCSWCTIKNYYECDSSQINDSHSCTSNNCAPDFINGHNYCCPSRQCAHRGLDVKILNGLPRSSIIADEAPSDLYCYSNGAVIQYQGDSLKCIDGMWNFITGDAEDFTDNCGKTISDFPLFFNRNITYPSTFGNYHNSYLVYPVSFPGKTKDVVAYIMPAEDFVQMDISKRFYEFEIDSKGDRKLIKQYQDSAVAAFSLLDDRQGERFDFHVDCYTPDGYECDHSESECWSNSYCSQDNPSNIAYDETKYYCCPKGTCAHNSSTDSKATCYPEGGHELLINGVTCLWECKDEIWGKRKKGELCSRNCDCADSEDGVSCKPTLYNNTNNICCPEGECGLKTGVCVGENETAQSNEYKNCVCQDGTWHCKSIIIEDKSSRILISKNTTYKTTLKLNTHLDKPAQINVMVFFDKKGYNGDVKIIGTGDCNINNNINIEEKNNIFEESISSGNYTCELEISAPDLLDKQYFFYTGSALILRYTALDLDSHCGDGVVEGLEECESTDLTKCDSSRYGSCGRISCSNCGCNDTLICDGSTCVEGSEDYSNYCLSDKGEDKDDTFDGTCSCDGDGYKKYTVEGDIIYVDCATDTCWTPVLKGTGGTELKLKWSRINSYKSSNCMDISDCNEITSEEDRTKCEDIQEGCLEENYNIKQSCIEVADRPACNKCDNLNYAGFSNWVLPDKDLLDDLSRSSTCRGGVCFDDINPYTYWSSTEVDSGMSYLMNCTNIGCNIQMNYKNKGSFIRCVRRPNETDCTNEIDDDLDGEIDACDSDCGYSGCSCDGTDYCVKNMDGDEVYVDCNADKCWTPTDYTGYVWGGYGIDNPSCIGDGSDYPACNYCDELKYGGREDWVLPDKNTLVELRESESCDGEGACFGWDGAHSYYWSSTQYDLNNSYAIFFNNLTSPGGTEIPVEVHINKSGLKDYRLSIRCVRE